jgi:hypothetical protein
MKIVDKPLRLLRCAAVCPSQPQALEVKRQVLVVLDRNQMDFCQPVVRCVQKGIQHEIVRHQLLTHVGRLRMRRQFTCSLAYCFLASMESGWLQYQTSPFRPLGGAGRPAARPARVWCTRG